jgi:hypothetical protein
MDRMESGPRPFRFRGFNRQTTEESNQQKGRAIGRRGMWNFNSKRNALREHLLLQAPEANPSEFIRRYLSQQSAQRNAVSVGRSAIRHRAADGRDQKAPA